MADPASLPQVDEQRASLRESERTSGRERLAAQAAERMAPVLAPNSLQPIKRIMETGARRLRSRRPAEAPDLFACLEKQCRSSGDAPSHDRGDKLGKVRAMQVQVPLSALLNLRDPTHNVCLDRMLEGKRRPPWPPLKSPDAWTASFEVRQTAVR